MFYRHIKKNRDTDENIKPSDRDAKKNEAAPPIIPASRAKNLEDGKHTVLITINTISMNPVRSGDSD